jgi:FdhE protein
VTASTTAWDRRIRRANQLAANGGPASSLVFFYERLLRSQAVLYDKLSNAGPLTGLLDDDLASIVWPARTLIAEIAAAGSDRLAVDGHALLESSDSSLRDRLVTYWQDRSDRQFFAKAILQAYGQALSDAGIAPRDSRRTSDEMRCPFCSGVPQLSVLEPANAGRSEPGGRRHLCATCLTAWACRRVRCAHCGEEDEHKLCYYRAADIDHVRVDACDTCGRYLKTIDLTRLGVAEPLVDEVAGAALDAWARERGYEKIELNLVGT